MLDDLARSLLSGPNIGHLATLLKDGSPHSVPLWVDLERDQIAIFTEPNALKARNMDRDGRVALSITQADRPLTSAVIRVSERVDGDRGWAIVDRMSQKYEGKPYPRDPEMVVYLIEPQKARATAY